MEYEDLELSPFTVESKEVETISFGNFSWCCTCSSSFSCMWTYEATLHSDQGDIEAEPTEPVTKNFGAFCEDCSTTSSRLGSPATTAGTKCRVGVDAGGPLIR